MKLPTRGIAKAAIILQVMFALLSVFYAIRSYYKPNDVGEFGLIKNAANDLYAMLALIISGMLLICAYGLVKFKGWAYVMSIIFCLLLMMILDMGYMYDPLLTFTVVNSLSLTSEILPVMILILLGMSFKEYVKPRK